MTRTEIRVAGKNIVAHHGPWQVLDSAPIFVEREHSDASATDQAAIIEEANLQANRVLDFLKV